MGSSDAPPYLHPPADGGVRMAEGPARVAITEGEVRWRHLDSSLSAVSFGFVATAILIAMFLVMAVFERFLRPQPRVQPPSPDPSRRRRRLWAFPTEPLPPSQELHPAAFPRKLDQSPPPKEVSVLMPGQAMPTFIARPALAPCPREPVAVPPSSSIASPPRP
ncbi:uncharacterized protein LOC144714740 isoform X2 [Wolffia australiana]